jgi:hypothetical protein
MIVADLKNWVEWDFQLGDLPAGDYTLTYQWHLADAKEIGCWAQVDNSSGTQDVTVCGRG